MKNTKMYYDIMEEKSIIIDCIQHNRSRIIEISDRINSFAPSSVVIVARGTSGNAAIAAKYWIEAFCGLPVSIAAPSIITKYRGNLDLKKALVIGISQSGEGLDICAVIDRGNETGAFTVAITNKENSTLASKTNFNINCVAGEELSVTATKSFVAQLCVSFMLAAYISKNIEIIKCIDYLVYNVIAGLQAQDLIVPALDKLHPFSSCSVVSRGFAFPVALEAANKLQEVASIPSSAYSAAEFAHGPIAISNKDNLVVLIDVGCKAHDEYLNLLKKLDSTGCQLLIITSNSHVYTRIDCITLNLPRTRNEIEGVFLVVPVIQMFALMISNKKGLDPDNVKGLSKVTITK